MTNKKILIITYYWPPAGGPGVQRWLKFAKYLPEFGWTPVIYTPENPSYPIIDETLLDEIPTDIEIVKTKIWEPYQLAEKLNKSNKKYKAGQFDVGENQSWKSKLSIFIRGNFFIPDARIFWVKPSIRFLKKYLQENNIDTIVTTGPPHSMHLIGLGLKKELKELRWIADFRDPWTEISYYKHLKLTDWADKKHRRLEREVFQNADMTLATSYTDADNFEKNGAHAVCITNGFDIENDIVSPRQNNKFILSYVGVLEQLRNPSNLWNALIEIVKENDEIAQNLEIKFVGRLDDKIFNALQASPLRKNLTIIGYLSHQRAVEEMQNSSLLLLTNFPEESSAGIIPGKLFEYLSTGNTILSVGPKNSDVAKILEETKAGKHFTYKNQNALREFLLESYENWKKGNLYTHTSGIENFSRKNLTKKLTEIINQFH